MFRINSLLAAIAMLALLLVGTVAQAAPIMIADWTFDDTGTTTAVDSVNGYNGTLSAAGITQGGVGAIGNSFTFAGNSINKAQVTVPNQVGAFSGVTYLTASGWFYFTQTPYWDGLPITTSTMHDMNLFTKYVPTASYQLQMGMTNPGPGVWYGDWYGTPTRNQQKLPYSVRPWTLNAWHQVVFTFDGSGANVVEHIYLDGDRTGEVYINNPSVGGLLKASTGVLTLGGRDAANGWWNGGLDDLAMWNGGMLGDAKVMALYQTPKVTAGLPGGTYGNGLFGTGLYNAKAMNLLFAKWDSSGSVGIGTLQWTYTTGLGYGAGNAGYDAGNSRYYVQLDGSTGMTAPYIIPEPSTLALLAAGLLGLLAYAWRKRK